ncbi:unnamed protein product [Fraxinus pennsylvanica]|uniref:Uncharacterized protein n=1 Tax=Fraxinus pennsylvanica TaxID=56036 RepID=A0AAD2A1V7_9LAMI|nr:unnamed protein product [Fraxinus pennsylvanica]
MSWICLVTSVNVGLGSVDPVRNLRETVRAKVRSGGEGESEIVVVKMIKNRAHLELLKEWQPADEVLQRLAGSGFDQIVVVKMIKNRAHLELLKEWQPVDEVLQRLAGSGFDQVKTFLKENYNVLGTLSFSPSAVILNHGQGLFEGLKAYQKYDGNILLVEPEENAFRLRVGAELTMCLLFHQECLAPIHLIVQTEMHRATPSGTGGVKTIGNYAAEPSVYLSIQIMDGSPLRPGGKIPMLVTKKGFHITLKSYKNVDVYIRR